MLLKLDFADVFRQTAQLARRAGLAKLAMVAIDGSKIRANTSRHKAMSYGRMKKEERRLEREMDLVCAAFNLRRLNVLLEATG